MIKAYRDTWTLGIHTYLAYLRDRLTVARGLLIDSGSIFVQIGNENVHRVRAMMDEVFGGENFVAQIVFEEDRVVTNSSVHSNSNSDFIISGMPRAKTTLQDTGNSNLRKDVGDQ